MKLFGLWIGSGEGRNRPDPQKDEYGRQYVISKGVEKPLFGGTLYYLIVRGKKGRYYVTKKMYDRVQKGDWARLV